MSIQRRGLGGFTLVEILIVVVIIGILAAMVIPQMSSATDEAKAGAAMANRRAIHAAILNYFKDHAEYPATIEAEWFVGDKLPPNPWAADWEGDTVQVYAGNDLERRIPESKTLNPNTNWARPYFYNANTGDVYLRVPDQGNDADTLALFNKINGLQLTDIRQDMP
ncbi:prepilin-type N-terminal cleavage/methylation domain-containing protein [Mucisphaera sp.]|uniref:prepilin-type N-terminal cleavage/methylation domain-containing protein n=1 Tax=Mucisphaera sp. TaxID=2913024 RepID=UPI003D0DEDF8